MKTCPKCKTGKPFSAFHVDRKSGGGVSSYCKECSNAFGREYRARPEIAARRKAAKAAMVPRERDGHLRRKYGISLEIYNAMLAEQGGRCAICRTANVGSKHGMFHTDHDHSSGKVRGLLCVGCNIGLGGFKDSEETLSLAIQYLERNK